VNDFIDRHRDTFGVEPICTVLQVAPSGYRRHAARVRDPSRRCARAQRDEVLMPRIEHVWQANLQVYGADKVWRQMKREGEEVARCTVERLMRRMRLRGAVRGKRVRTTVPDVKQSCPQDRVNRQFKADRPNQLWVSDFTYVSTWQGSQYVSIRYSERLAEAGVEPSVGSRGDSYDNALAETINGLYKAELIHRRDPPKTRESLELATLEWVAWFNHHRLLEPIGYITPVEAEANYYKQLAEHAELSACT